jgi:hypothetical protein
VVMGSDDGMLRPLGELAEVETDVAQPARMADYLKGGEANFSIDRDTAEYLTSPLPRGIDSAREIAHISRQWRIDVVRYLTRDAGIRQFLNIESHLPSDEATHRIAQAVAPECRVFYVITEAVVLAHAHTFLLTCTPEGRTSYVARSDHDPAQVLSQASAGTLDLDQPVAVILTGVSQRLCDEDPYEVVRGLMAGVPRGSYLVLSHLGDDLWEGELIEAAKRMEERMDELVRAQKMRPIVSRSHADIVAMFGDLELLGSGLAPVDRWDPHAAEQSCPPFPGAGTPIYGGVARKP